LQPTMQVGWLTIIFLSIRSTAWEGRLMKDALTTT
jgi:hypothetical protein